MLTMTPKQGFNSGTRRRTFGRELPLSRSSRKGEELGVDQGFDGPFMPLDPLSWIWRWYREYKNASNSQDFLYEQLTYRLVLHTTNRPKLHIDK